MSGQTIDDFDENRYFAEYIDAAAGVIYSGIMKIAGSFRRTAIVYIQ